MSITQKEIARKLNISMMTVSRVLSGKAGNKVSASLAQKIWETAEQADYHENRLAKAMRTGFVPLSVLCLHRPAASDSVRISSQFYWFDLISNYTSVLTEHKLETLLVAFSTPEELSSRLRALKSANLISSIAANISPDYEEEEIKVIQEIGLPYILLGHPKDESLPYVYVENRNVSSLLLDLLRPLGAKELRFYDSTMPLPASKDAKNPQVFFHVSNLQERNILHQLSNIPLRRLYVATGNSYALTGCGGFLVDAHTRERCQNAYQILHHQQEGKTVPQRLKKITISAADISFIDPPKPNDGSPCSNVFKHNLS